VPLFIFLFGFLMGRGYFPTTLSAALFLIGGMFVYFLLYYPLTTWFYKKRVVRYVVNGVRGK